MKNLNSCHKPISMFVIIAFTLMLCFWANQTPAAPTNSAPEKSSDSSLENNMDESTGFIEQDAPAPAIKKGKKFPWLIAALVVVAGGAAVYFLVLKKKKYTLTVTVGEGVTGTPAAGTSTNEKGTAINYNYSLQSGYSDLSVTLDGAPVAASGAVTMNANHTLEAKAIKTFVLTVSKGEHIVGTPNSGTYSHARGSNVTYSYAPASGYSNLEVKLDNVPVANSGTIAMEGNHSLTAILKGANIAVNSTPAGARIFLNNVDSGQVTPYIFTYSSAVTRNVLLQYSCGYKEYSQSVSVAFGETKTINHSFVTGIREDFEVPPSACWLPYHSSSWDHTGHGEYRYSGAATRWSTSAYSHFFSGNYTVIIRMYRKAGSTTASNAFFLGSGSDMTNASGYAFYYFASGQYGIARTTNYNFITASGSVFTIKSPTVSAAIKTGLSNFNVLKVVKSGSQYSFYINNTLLHTFSDSTHAANYTALALYCGGVTTVMEYEYVYLNPSS
ncbi:MAG: PEGA domain-containing protein [Chrysiogenales bacterium]|nr:MAG: PEGA domain-containing protein [Chrysiogenales bacterium]